MSARNVPIGTIMADVQPEAVEWLWPGRVPFGRLTLLDGDPGTGKSQVTLDIAARLSRGCPMPGCDAPTDTAGTVLCSAEDDLASTVRPRLDAAGADTRHVLALSMVPDGDGQRPLTLPDDIALVAEGIERVRARLLVIDPVTAFLTGKADTHKDADVRRVLFQVAELASATGVAVLLVRHLTKTPGGSPLYRGSGSIAFIGAARSGLLVGKDPDDEARRVLAPNKSNLCAPASSLAFHLESSGGVSRVVWDGESRHNAAALVAEQGDPTALDDAKDALRAILADGPLTANEVRRRVSSEGVSWATALRAKKALGIDPKKSGLRGGWTWGLPNTLNPEIVSTFGIFGEDAQPAVSTFHAQGPTPSMMVPPTPTLDLTD